MKAIIAILTAIIYCLLCSCSTIGLYTKNQAINKFCRTDSVTTFVTVRDTFHVPPQKADTIFTASPCDTSRTDSVTVKNGKVSATYKRKGNKIQLQANYLGDTAIKEKVITVTAPCNCPPCPELPWYKQLGADYWWVLPAIVIGMLLLARFRKYLNTI